jgi:cob(I)alamin adenosyltransferase
MLLIAPPPTLTIAPGLREFPTDLYAEALRKAASGQTVAIYQLLKGGINQGADRPIELTPDLLWYRCDRPHCIGVGYDEADRAAVRNLWHHACANDSDVVILDELGLAIGLGVIGADEVLQLLRDRQNVIAVGISIC